MQNFEEFLLKIKQIEQIYQNKGVAAEVAELVSNLKRELPNNIEDLDSIIEHIKDELLNKNHAFHAEQVVDISTDIKNTYIALLPYTSIAYFFEKKGDPKEHAKVLATLFTSRVESIDYLQRFISTYKTIKDLVHQSADINYPSEFGETPLLIAVGGGNTELAVSLIELGAKVNQADLYGNLPLTIACAHNDDELVAKLIEYGADINSSGNTMGETPLVCAIRHGHNELALSLIELGANIDEEGEGATPLTAAISTKNQTMIDKLLDLRVNINKVDMHGDIPLLLAIKTENHELAFKLINTGAKVDIFDQEGNTPLLAAVEKNKNSLAIKIIKRGADINAIGNTMGETALVAAIGNRNDDLVLELIHMGADVNKANPLLTAVQSNNNKIVDVLLGKNADVNQSDQFGNTPLLMAVMMENNDIALKLINKGASFDIANNKGLTAYDLAKKHSNSQLIQAMDTIKLAKGSKKAPEMFVGQKKLELKLKELMDKDTPKDLFKLLRDTKSSADTTVLYNNNKITLLMYASFTGAVNTVKFLLQHKVRVNKLDPVGNNALFYALQGKKEENKETLIKMLVDKDISLNVTNKDGQTILDVAKKELKQNKEQILEYLQTSLEKQHKPSQAG